MSKKWERRIWTFIAGTLSFAVFGVFGSHFFRSKGIPPQPWEMMFDDKHVTIMASLAMGFVFVLKQWMNDQTAHSDETGYSIRSDFKKVALWFAAGFLVVFITFLLCDYFLQIEEDLLPHEIVLRYLWVYALFGIFGGTASAGWHILREMDAR